MVEKLPSPTELRAQARRHREAAAREPDPQTREARLTLAAEYEKLAQEVEQHRH